MNEIYIEKGGKKLRCGYTTGSCAQAAAKASLLMLLDNILVDSVSILTPKNILYHAEIADVTIEKRNDTGLKRFVSCAVIKDGGDDPDATNGMKIYAKVGIIGESENGNLVIIDGGEGIGRVTKKGLDQPVGNAAINSVPRKMITGELTKVLEDHNSSNANVKVIISAPLGEEIAKKTFNPRLGIVGGISIIGTTGIVEPMSDEALIATIKTQVKMLRARDLKTLVAAPGNYGIKFLYDKYGIIEDDVVMTSNFIYDAVRICVDEGVENLIFAGHLGKLVKVAGGIKNTHSCYGDHRMEILTDISSSFCEGESFNNLKQKLLNCVMTDEAVKHINEAGIGDKVCEKLVMLIKKNIEEWSEYKIKAEVIVFLNDYTILASTANTEKMINELKGKL